MIVRTENDFLLGKNGAGIMPILPVSIRTKQQAYRTAAWILAMGEVLPDEDPPSTFDDVRAAIEST